jgi:hypothetical protein
MINIESYFMALKAAWVPHILKDIDRNADWTFFPNHFLSLNINDFALLKINICDPSEFQPNHVITPFYTNLMMSFNKCKERKKLSNLPVFLNSVIWGNSCLYYKQKNKNMIVNFKNWQKCGIIFVNQLKFINGQLDQQYIWDIITDKRNVFSDIKKMQMVLSVYKEYLVDIEPSPPSSWYEVQLQDLFEKKIL